ncbi:MAG: OmpP1/FadL family transporter, partial [Pseudomonadales bacterium]
HVDGTQLMVSGGIVNSDIEFDVERTTPMNGIGDGGDAGDTAPIASAFYVRHLSDDWSFGISFAGLTGAVLEYDDGWAGRFQAEEVELLGLVLMPSIAYRLNDHVSFGFGLPVMYTDLELDVAIPQPGGTPDGRATIDGDDTVVSFNLSTLIEFSETSRLGIVYQHEFDISYSGGVEIQPLGAAVGAETDLMMASLVRASFTQEMSDDLTVHLTVGWDDWSALEEINISTQSGGATLLRNWDDTYHVAWGFDYRFNPKWQMRGGVAYDTNPVDKEDRTADMPMDRQVRYALGAGYTPSDKLSIGAELVYADYGSSKIDAMGYGGEYDTNDLIFFSVNANWKLGK